MTLFETRGSSIQATSTSTMIIAGRISYDGTVAGNGDGYGITLNGNSYVITFTPPFETAPSITVTPLAVDPTRVPGGGSGWHGQSTHDTDVRAVLLNVTASQAIVATITNTPAAPKNLSFTFVAIGQTGTNK